MNLMILDGNYSVCQINNIDLSNLKSNFFSITKTSDEISVVCKSEYEPSNSIKIDKNWKLIKINEILDFSLIGIISKISNILALNDISLFVISTYNTDYFMVKEIYLNKTIDVLTNAGYTF